MTEMALNFGIGLPNSRPTVEVCELAKKAENEGFNRIWLGDHYFNRNPFLLLSAIAGQTSQIQLGTAITNPFHISPAVIATTALTLDELSNNRFLLGLGPGDKITLHEIGIYPKKPLIALHQSIKAIRDLWSGELVSGTIGNHHWNKAKLKLPSKRPIPIFVGVQGKMMTKLALEVGDGLIFNGCTPFDFQWIKTIGRPSIKDFEMIAYLITEISDDASPLLKLWVAQVVAGLSPEILAIHDIPLNDFQLIAQLIKKKQYPAAQAVVTPQMLDSFSVLGKPNVVEARLEELRKEGVKGYIFGGPLAKDRQTGIHILSEIIHSF
jgi:5,10-methylenetetrahydromethanopterin reductase